MQLPFAIVESWVEMGTELAVSGQIQVQVQVQVRFSLKSKKSRAEQSKAKQNRAGRQGNWRSTERPVCLVLQLQMHRDTGVGDGGTALDGLVPDSGVP